MLVGFFSSYFLSHYTFGLTLETLFYLVFDLYQRPGVRFGCGGSWWDGTG